MNVSALINETGDVEIKEAKLDDAALGFSIGTISSTVLRGLLRSICDTVPEAKDKAIEHLLVAKNKIPILPGSKCNQDACKGTDLSDQQSRRRRPRYSQCENCKQEFDTLSNASTACRYHTGKILWIMLLIKYLIPF